MNVFIFACRMFVCALIIGLAFALNPIVGAVLAVSFTITLLRPDSRFAGLIRGRSTIPAKRPRSSVTGAIRGQQGHVVSVIGNGNTINIGTEESAPPARAILWPNEPPPDGWTLGPNRIVELTGGVESRRILGPIDDDVVQVWGDGGVIAEYFTTDERLDPMMRRAAEQAVAEDVPSGEDPATWYFDRAKKLTHQWALERANQRMYEAKKNREAKELADWLAGKDIIDAADKFIADLNAGELRRDELDRKLYRNDDE